jgi:xanthine dehydrogenase small subunit
MIEFILNNKNIYTNLPPTTVLLDFIRREKRLTGTKEGCREGDCGACTLLLGEIQNKKVVYKSVNSCLVPLIDVHAKHVVTVEGFNQQELTPIQLALVEEGGTQCGFCTPGFVISMTGYFINHSKPITNDAIQSLGGNICRCTGYKGIERAIIKSIDAYLGVVGKNHIKKLIAGKFIPEYFIEISKRLSLIKLPKEKRSDKKFYVGGGTDLYVQRWEEIVQSDANFVKIDKLSPEISKTKNKIRIGGAATIQQILESSIIKKHFPSLQNQLELFGSLPIRNRATVAGNIVNASPIGDFTNILMALDADIHLKNGKRKKTIFLRDFYKGYKSLNKTKDEIVEWITIPIPPKKFFFNYEKVSKRTYLDIASVNSTIAFTMSKNKINCVGLSAGGVAPIPLSLDKTCSFLNGKEINSSTIKVAAGIAMAETTPITDARGATEYKKLLLRQLIYAHFLMLFPQQVNPEELI